MSKSKGDHDEKLRLLVVDHDQHFLSTFVQLLRSYSYEVTAVEFASTALEILTQEPQQFDLMLAEMNLPDFNWLTLVRVADKMGLHTMLMTSKLESSSIDSVLKSGALLLLEKPLTEESIKYISQILKKEKMRSYKNTEERGKLNRNIQIYDDSIKLMADNEKNNLINPAPKKRGRKPWRLSYDAESLLNRSKLEGRICAKWTDELHAMFMDAVHSLGSTGRCYPVDILERMNVPGLTRVQVASHLQKCRMNWKNAYQKSKCYGLKREPNTDGNGQVQNVFDKKLGSMPFPNHPSNHANPQYHPQILPTPRDIESIGSSAGGITASKKFIASATDIGNPYEVLNANMTSASKDVSVGAFNYNRTSSSGISNFHNPFEMSKMNPMLETVLVMPTDPNVAMSMIDSLAIASSSQKSIQQSREFTYMLAEGDEYFPSFAGEDNGWINNYTDNTRTQYASSDFLSEQFTMGQNKQEPEPRGQSSFLGGKTTKFLGE